MKRRIDAIVKCPYYNGEVRQVLYCEGVQEGAALHLAFDTPQHHKDYKKQYCKGDYNCCLLAQMLNKKWDYEG